MLELYLLIALVYSIVETLEKLGLQKKYAHLLALPIGIAGSFFFYDCSSFKECLLKGILIGFGAIGSCDTLCNLRELKR